MLKTTIKHLAKLCEGELINCHVDFPIQGVSIDTRQMNQAQIFIPIKGERFDGHAFIDNAFREGALVSLVNDDYDVSYFKSPLIRVKNTNQALQTLASNYLAEVGAKVVAITGSNGKTTVKDIIASLLSTQFEVLKTSGNFNNAIGLPLTLLQLEPTTQIAVLEMGMDHQGELDLLSQIAPPDIAIITSIGKAHLVELKTIENIVQAKLEITNHLNPNGLLIVNGDSDELMNGIKHKHIPQKILTYGVKSHNDVIITGRSQFIDSLIFSINQLCDQPIRVNLLGRFQAHNVTAALIACRAFGLKPEALEQQLLSLSLSANRNAIFKLDQAIIIDDTYKSNPESLTEALQLLADYQNDGIKIAVLGDMLDLGPDEILYHQEIGQLINQLKIDRLYTLGNLSHHFSKDSRIINEHFESKEALLNSLSPWLKQNSTILFKASHSLGFTEIVNRLREKQAKPKIAVIFGGKSSEYSVSLSSTYSLYHHFPTDLFEPVYVAMDQQGKLFTGDFSANEIRDDLYKKNETCQQISIHPNQPSSFINLATNETIQVQAVFNLIHGKYGEDGILQALLTAGNFKYTGCDGQSSILCYDKDLTHRLLDHQAIAKAKYITLTRLISEQAYQQLIDELGPKVIIKPAREGSSYGISVATNFSEFYDGLHQALQYDKKVVIEEFIEGFEIGCSILQQGDKTIVGTIDEIELHTSFFDFEAKYQHKDAHIHCPARIQPWQEAQTKEIALKVFKHLECRDYARVDFFIRHSDGKVFFNEINTIPGFTAASRYPTMMAQAGVSYQQVITTLILNALHRE